MDLLDWHRDRLSTRRLAVLIKHLPRDSALTRELHDDAADWSTTDYLLANVVDHLAVANWMFATINRDEDADPLDPPEPVTRPVNPSGPAGPLGEESDEVSDGTATRREAGPEVSASTLALFFGAGTQ